MTYWNREYTAMKGDIKLQLYRRRAEGARLRAKLRFPCSSWSMARRWRRCPSWDLNVPGAGEYSMMNVFARLGYDVWAIDFEGYGKSSRNPKANSDIKSGVADLEAMMPIVERETGQQKFHFMGSSSGALRMAALCGGSSRPRRPRSCSAPTPTRARARRRWTDRAKQLEFYQKNNTRPRPR